MNRRQRATLGLVASSVGAAVAGVVACGAIALVLTPQDSSGGPTYDPRGFAIAGLALVVGIVFVGFAFRCGRAAFRSPGRDERPGA